MRTFWYTFLTSSCPDKATLYFLREAILHTWCYYVFWKLRRAEGITTTRRRTCHTTFLFKHLLPHVLFLNRFWPYQHQINWVSVKTTSSWQFDHSDKLLLKINLYFYYQQCSYIGLTNAFLFCSWFLVDKCNIKSVLFEC